HPGPRWAPWHSALVGGGRLFTHELGGIDWPRALAQLEMHLRLADRAGRAGLGDDLTAAHLVAALHQDLLIVCVGRHPVIGMADQNEIAVALELVAGVRDHAILSRHHRGSLRHGEVDAVIVAAIGLGAEARDHASLHRPAEAIA